MLTAQLHSKTDEVSPVSNHSSILFIEDMDKKQADYHSFFRQSYFAGGFKEAIAILNEMKSNGQAPDLLVIDLHLFEDRLAAFRLWLKETFKTEIPVVYNATALTQKDIKQLFEKKLVEDVVNVHTHYRSLPYKAKFLKKVAAAGSVRKNKRKQAIKAKPQYRFSAIKRLIDFVLALTAIIICLPIFILIALAIRVESKGPIFYCAKRAGKGYKVFRFFKFRTMIVDADKKVAELANLNQYKDSENGPAFFKIKNDPRVTRLGAFLRNTSLDELPQLFNVLLGDMSIVGNRPLPLYEANSLTTNEWAERFMAPAGITGLWQISKRGKEDMSNAERISLDIAYARNRSLKGDLKIMFKTPSVLLQKSNV